MELVPLFHAGGADGHGWHAKTASSLRSTGQVLANEAGRDVADEGIAILVEGDVTGLEVQLDVLAPPLPVQGIGVRDRDGEIVLPDMVDPAVAAAAGLILVDSQGLAATLTNCRLGGGLIGGCVRVAADACALHLLLTKPCFITLAAL